MLASFEERGQNNRLVKQTIVDDNKFEKKTNNNNKCLQGMFRPLTKSGS